MQKRAIGILPAIIIAAILLVGCGQRMEENGAENVQPSEPETTQEDGLMPERELSEAEEPEPTELRLLTKKQIVYPDGTIDVMEEYEYDESGNMIKDFFGGDRSSCNSEYEYDESGNLIKRIRYYFDDDNLRGWSEIEYDEFGSEIKTDFYDMDGSLKRSSEYGYQYDESGNLIKQISYTADGSIGWQEEHEYDKFGNEIKETVYSSDGSVSYVTWWVLEYDESGNKIKEQENSLSDLCKVREYDTYGNEKSITAYDKDGSIKYWAKYEYDDFGNQTKYIRGITDMDRVYDWYEYEYDLSGNLIKEVSYSANGIEDRWHEYEYKYDSSGNFITRDYYSYNGMTTESIYDIFGNPIREVHYQADGSIYMEYQWEYITVIPETTVPTAEGDNLALKYRELPDIEVDYIPELAYHGTDQIHETYDPMIFACWKDMLIIGDTIYRREDDIYKRTEEQLQDWFNISGRLDHAYQWENLLVAEHRDIADDRDKIFVLDMDSGQTWSYPFGGYAWHVYQGKIYYRERDKGILCMDLLSGEVEVIYAHEGGGSLMIRDNGDMIMNTRNETDPRIWEFWFLSYDAQGDLDAEKIWETETYEFVFLIEFNKHGLFLIGDFYHGMDRDASDELLWLKDNGEREGMAQGRIIGKIIVDEGYFLWDSQMLSEEEKVEILASWDYDRPREAEAVVDSISYYDFQGNKLQTWQLIDDEMLEAGYRLKCIVYDNGDILAFYENEEFDDLYISRVQTL